MPTPFDQLRRLLPLAMNRQMPESTVMSDLESWFQYHQQNVIENWLWYGGYHNMFLRRLPGENERDFMARAQTATVENHVQPVIDIIASNLYPDEEGPKRYVTRKGQPDPELNDLLEKIVFNHLTEDHDDAKALTTLVTGYSIIQRELIDIRTEKRFPLGSSPLQMVKYGYLRKTPLDTAYCVPIPRVREGGIRDDRAVGGILFVINTDNFLGSIEAMDLMGKVVEQKTIIEYVDDVYWLRWEKNKNENKWTQVTVNSGTQFQNRNQYGDVNIPFTVYRNTGDPFSVEGESEVRAIRGINAELNDLSNGDRDVITYHQYPVLMGLNGASIPNGWVRTKNSVLELEKKDAKFEYLEWKGTLDESRMRQDSLRHVISQVKGVGLLSRGFMKEIGQIRSGPPLKALFTSDRSTMSRKFKYFGEGERADMKADLRYWEKVTGADLGLDTEIQFHCEFEQDFLGIDELLEAEIAAVKAGSGTEDINEIMKEIHPDWTDAEIESALKRSQKFLQSQRKPQGQSSEKKAAQQGA